MNRSLLCAGAILLAAGCGTGSGDERFIPSEGIAQRNLEMALGAWAAGRPPGLVQEASPAVRLVDTHHRPGQKLAAFSVLGPTTGDAHRCFAVRLTFDDPREEVRARFVVFGLDPLWVMRYEDYEMVMHWCDPPPRPGASPRPGS
jgi:hypothetical protein